MSATPTHDVRTRRLTFTETMVIVSAVAGFLVLVLSGVNVPSSVLLIVVVGAQGYAGAVVWKAVSRRADGLLTVGMGLAIGTALSLLSGLLIQILGWGTWGWLVPPVVAVSVTLVRRATSIGWIDPGPGAASRPDRPAIVAVTIGAALSLASLGTNMLNYPLTWEGTWSRYHTDMPFFEALATSIARFGPLDSIFLPDAQVRYHWLVYGWAGQVTEAAHAQPFVIMTRVLPFVAMLAGSCIVVAWARRMSTVSWVPSLAVVLLLLGGFLGAINGGVFNFDSPSQSLSVVWLLTLVIAVLELLDDPERRRRATIGLFALIAVLAFCVMGGKVSTAVPAIAGIGLVAAVGLVRREPWRLRALAAAIVVVGFAGLAFILIVSGATGGGGLTLGSLIDRASSQQGLNPVDGTIGVVAGTAVLLVAIAARWAGLAWLGIASRSRWEPTTILGFGLALSSLAAIVAFNSFNEIWFSVAASAPLAVLSAVGVGDATDYLADGDQRRQRRIAILAAVAAAIVYLVVWLLWSTGASGGNVWTGTLRWAGPLLGVLLAAGFGAFVAVYARRGRGRLRPRAFVAAAVAVLVFATVPGRLLGVGTGQVGVLQSGIRNEWFSVDVGPLVQGRDSTTVRDWTADLMAAAAWLRAAAGEDDLIATNLTFGPFVAGVTGLRTYVSGLQYQGPYGHSADVPELLAREGQVWDFIDGPSASTAGPLCSAGVSWVWVDPKLTETRDWQPYATVAFTNADATILQMDPASCAE